MNDIDEMIDDEPFEQRWIRENEGWVINEEFVGSVDLEYEDNGLEELEVDSD